MVDHESRGERAKHLLENELFKEAFEALEKEYTQQWRDSPIRDTEGREKIHLAIHQLDRVRTHLENLVLTGEMEKESRLKKAFNFNF